MHFFMAMQPPTVTHHNKRLGKTKSGRPVLFDSEELKTAKTKLAAHLAQHVPAQPMTGAVALQVKWCFPIVGDHTDGEWKTSKPDTDNLQKALKDQMTKLGFWRDDAQVACEFIEKHYAAVPGVYVSVTDL